MHSNISDSLHEPEKDDFFNERYCKRRERIDGYDRAITDCEIAVRRRGQA